jgi:hypothetical protein
MSQQMRNQQRNEQRATTGLREPVRLRYFHGMLLDVYHFELEQDYFNEKRWLANRLITGSGVVCGLDVKLTDDGKGVFVLPGFAIDRCGREIVVAHQSKPITLPPMPSHESDKSPPPEQSEQYRERHERHDYCEEEYAHVVLCYHECPSDPVPVMAGDCETVTMCASGSVRERYELKIREGFAPERKTNFPDVIDGRRINYTAIVDYVTRGCRQPPDDCCIPLANIRLKDSPAGWEPEPDIGCRQIVYTNRLLFELLMSLVRKEESEY